jgi:hypothetical protein
MVLVEQRNAERFGLEQYQVSLARRMLEDARLRSATDAVPADSGVAQ